MKVEIIRGSVLHNHKSYGIGDVIKQIARPDGERLIKKKVAVEYFDKPKTDDSGNSEGDPGSPGENLGDGENTNVTGDAGDGQKDATPSENSEENDSGENETTDEDEE